MSVPSRDPPGGGDGPGDHLTILSGVSQNVVGIACAGAAVLTVQVLMTRTLGPNGYGVVTVLTQAAFVTSFATRAGMDMAVLRDVAVEVGVQRYGRIRAAVGRSALIAAAASLCVAILVVLLQGPVLQAFSISESGGAGAVAGAALGLPFLALANVWLAATRGLKIMRYTLYVFWVGQNVAWIALTLLLWRFSTTASASVLAYSLSWAWAAAAAGYFWRRESRSWPATPLEPGWFGRLMRYAGPRGPAALFAQLLFWTDLFVVTRFVSDQQVGIYSAALRAGQVVVLFLTSVNLMFSPFVADLHNRGETRRLDGLFKSLTRWIVAATLPMFLLIAVAPGSVLDIFGIEFSGGIAALLILLAGQFVHVATGSVGFILVMVGRTGWDMAVYAGSLLLDLALAFWLCPRYGIEGAAIANAITFACSNAVRLLLVRRFVSIQPYDRDYSRLLAPTVLAGGVMWLVHETIAAGPLVDLALTGGLGGAAYGLVYLAVGLTPAERRGAAALLGTFRGRRHRGGA